MKLIGGHDHINHAECAIYDAIEAVEKTGSHPVLNMALLHLKQAKTKVQDYLKLELERIAEMDADNVEECHERGCK